MTSRAARIETILRRELTPETIEVTDESQLHAGHAGARPEGETHFRVFVVANRFEGMGRVDRQRLVNRLLEDEFDNGLHALAQTLKAPAEM
jgi:BolA protein